MNARAGALSIEGTGVINSDGVVTLTAGGGISTAGNVTTTGDDVNYESATTLTGDILVNTGTGTGDITFASTIDAAALGTQTLTVNAAEDAIFNGNIGAISPGTALGALTVTAGGKINLNSAIVNTERNAIAGTTGDQVFNSFVVLGNTVGSTLTSTGAGNIQFNSIIDAKVTGKQYLTVSAADSAIFGNHINSSSIGDNEALGYLDVDANTNGRSSGNIYLNSQVVHTNSTAGLSGNQIYRDAVVLGNQSDNGSTLTSTGGGNIQFNSTIDAHGAGEQYLVVLAAHNAIFGNNSDTGSIGFNEALGYLDVNAHTSGGGNIQLNSEVVNTNSTAPSLGQSGNQIYHAAVVLGNTVAHGSTLTSNATGKGNISFASTIDADGIGTQFLTVSAADNALFGDNSDTGSIGFKNALGLLTVTANTNSTGLGKIRLNSEVVNTNSVLFGQGAGNQCFNSAVVLGNTVGSTLTSTGFGEIDFFLARLTRRLLARRP